MQTDNKFLDDLAKMAQSGAGLLMDVKREIETAVQAQVEKLLRNMNLVTREEFETVRQMAIKAREENEALKKKFDEQFPRKSGG